MNLCLFGNADGPTAEFYAGRLDSMDWGMIWGMILGLSFLILFFLPNFIHFVRRPEERYTSKNKVMKALEWIGGIASSILAVIYLPLGDWGFGSVAGLLFYFFGSIVLILTNWILWIIYLCRTRTVHKKAGGGIVTAILPVLLFLLHGITLQYVPLIGTAILFTIGHIYSVVENIKSANMENIGEGKEIE